jgi:hypothetical protein
MVDKYWIKLYLAILDDPKMATLPDRLWRRVIELFLLAGQFHGDGNLPDTKQLAWMLRMNTDDLDGDMKQIESTEIIQRTKTGWFVCKFAERQSPSTGSERVRQFRERQHKQQYNGIVTDMKRNVTQINRLTDNRLTESDCADNSTISIFCNVTGMVSIPGGETDKVLPALEALHKNRSDNELIEYLRPFYGEWTTRTSKKGTAYSKANCSWLYDWAIAGQIPDKAYIPAHAIYTEAL